MKFIKERPIEYDLLNNLDLRSAFEDEENEPMIFTFLKAVGFISGTWIIYHIGKNGLHSYSYLYSSETEYEEDCRILGLDY